MLRNGHGGIDLAPPAKASGTASSRSQAKHLAQGGNLVHERHGQVPMPDAQDAHAPRCPMRPCLWVLPGAGRGCTLKNPCKCEKAEAAPKKPYGKKRLWAAQDPQENIEGRKRPDFLIMVSIYGKRNKPRPRHGIAVCSYA
jgi:hypothetical protein